MSRKKKNTDTLYRNIKLEFIPDKDAEIFLIKNCEYRHFLYNKCVSLVKHYQDNDPDGYIDAISKYELLWEIRRFYEKSYSVRPDFLEPYDYYFRGISECVVDDIYTTINKIITERLKRNISDLHYIKYDPNHLTFRLKTKVDVKRDRTYRIITTENPYMIGIKINNTKIYPLGIKLKEAFTKLNIDLKLVKEIGFKFHNEKWYLCLIMDYNPYPEDYVEVRYDHKQKDLAGIDLGEENPVVLYDGKKIKKIPKHLQYPKERIKKVSRRIERLQAAMDRKYNPDMDRFHQSKNYYKVLKKFHKAWEHLVNIKKDWHFKLAHWIVTHYKTIVVDEFRDHIIKENDKMIKDVRKKMNKSMYNKSIHDLIRRLIHMCHKYGTNYYKVIENDVKSSKTTNTCNQCGNVNTNKLSYVNYKREKYFKCESCGYTINRDVNAAINCYNLYNNVSTRKLFLELI